MKKEVKFFCQRHLRNRFDLWLRHAQESLVRCHAERIVNNIYYDSLNLRDFYDNVVGLSNRIKSRVRWYGDTVVPATMALEHKIKRGRVSKKRVIHLQGLDLSATTHRQLARVLTERADLQSCMAASQFINPVLRNSYRRQYFEKRGGWLRMTIDSDLIFYNAMTEKLP